MDTCIKCVVVWNVKMYIMDRVYVRAPAVISWMRRIGNDINAAWLMEGKWCYSEVYCHPYYDL